MRKMLIALVLAITLSSCNSNTVFAEYASFNGTWEVNNKVAFSVKAPDSINPYNIFINIRNNQDYPYSNLFLIVKMDFPDNKTLVDTLEYEMAKADGTWLGKGFSSVKENKLWYKENVVFPTTGTYKITVEHAMRKPGSIEGITQLPGIVNVGIHLEKALKK